MESVIFLTAPCLCCGFDDQVQTTFNSPTVFHCVNCDKTFTARDVKRYFARAKRLWTQALSDAQSIIPRNSRSAAFEN